MKFHGRKRTMHYDAHVTTRHITATSKADAKQQAIKTVKVRES
jgi:hypothetical protein